MKKISRRAVTVLLLAALIVAGLTLYVLRWVDEGRSWALTFSRLNSDASGTLSDRSGVLLASFDPSGVRYAEDPAVRLACSTVVGDEWGRSGTGALTQFRDELREYSPLTGVEQSGHVDLTLTVDASLSQTALEALDGRSGAILLMNYRTGEMLCMVSAPSADPLSGEEPPEGAYLNHCLSASFPPGSIYKLITAAAALENLPDLESRRFSCEGWIGFGEGGVRCSGVHGEQTFEQALANSCNVCFSSLAVELGQDLMYRYAEAFGLLEGHELDGIPTAAGSYPPPREPLEPAELGWSGIGQSRDLVNPYGMLRYVAAIANGGVLAEPHLIAGHGGAGERILRADTAERLRELMSYTVAAHYENEERFPGLKLCAKTGTAEVGDGSSHAWFVGFLADEEHPYAFVVLVEHGGGGLDVAGPVANVLLQAAVTPSP